MQLNGANNYPDIKKPVMVGGYRTDKTVEMPGTNSFVFTAGG